MLQIGQSGAPVRERDVDVVGAWVACLEWQAGVLSALRPAERAMCRSGVEGREKRVWWVVRKREARWV